MNNQSAQLLAFPLCRRTALVRHATRELSALNGEAANSYWRKMAQGLLTELTCQGQTQEVARREVLYFFEAVQAEFRREVAEQQTSAKARV